jgi:hypothetical protein
MQPTLAKSESTRDRSDGEKGGRNLRKLGDEASDRVFVRDLNELFRQLEDRVRCVALREQTGLYLVGPPGTGKTRVVRQTLEKLSLPFAVKNARMSPLGFFETLSRLPDHTHVLDDLWAAFSRDEFLSILLPAVDGDPKAARMVHYTIKGTQLETAFRGGIIGISNLPLRHDPLIEALRSRIVVHCHEPDDRMIAAYMRHVARQGFEDLSPAECRKVADFVVGESRDCAVRLDLRQYFNALRDFRSHKRGLIQTSWTVLFRANLRMVSSNFSRPLSRHEQRERDLQIVREVLRRFPKDRGRQLLESGMRKSKFHELKRILRVAQQSGKSP